MAKTKIEHKQLLQLLIWKLYLEDGEIAISVYYIIENKT